MIYLSNVLVPKSIGPGMPNTDATSWVSYQEAEIYREGKIVRLLI
jgi:hypothetical protein